MTPNTASRSRRVFFARGLMFSFGSPERGRRECRAPNAPAAWWAEKGRGAHQQSSPRVYRKHPAFPAQWFYGLLRALPGEPGLFATVISGIASTDLDTSVGVSGPHDFAVRLRYLRLGTFRVHRILSRVRDVASRPSEWDRTMLDIGVRFISVNQNIFSEGTGPGKSR
jgi:hypothetical protein